MSRGERAGDCPLGLIFGPLEDKCGLCSGGAHDRSTTSASVPRCNIVSHLDYKNLTEPDPGQPRTVLSFTADMKSLTRTIRDNNDVHIMNYFASSADAYEYQISNLSTTIDG